MAAGGVEAVGRAWDRRPTSLRATVEAGGWGGWEWGEKGERRGVVEATGDGLVGRGDVGRRGGGERTRKELRG